MHCLRSVLFKASSDHNQSNLYSTLSSAPFDCLFVCVQLYDLDRCILFPLQGPEDEAEGEEGAEAKTPEEEIIPVYVPPESKPWETYGSELEIAEEACVNNRPLVFQLFLNSLRLFLLL